jgi:hypothetical protein
MSFVGGNISSGLLTVVGEWQVTFKRWRLYFTSLITGKSN